MSTLHVDFDWEQQVEVGNNSNEGQITTAWDSDSEWSVLKHVLCHVIHFPCVSVTSIKLDEYNEYCCSVSVSSSLPTSLFL